MKSGQRKKRSSAEMRRLILDAAKSLFVDKGYRNVSVRNIAAKIGYSPSALYRHFNNKKEILLVLRHEGFMNMLGWQENLRADHENPLERLRAGGLKYLEFAAQHPGYYDLMFNRGPMGDEDDELSIPPIKSFENLRETVRECVESGLFKITDIEAAAVSFWSLLHGLAILRNSGRLAKCIEADSSELIRQAINFSLRP